VDILDLIPLSGRLLPRLMRLTVIVLLLFFPRIAVGIVLQAGQEEGATFITTVHALVQKELHRPGIGREAGTQARYRLPVKR